MPNLINFANDLTPALRRVFFETQIADQQSPLFRLYSVENTNAAVEESVGMGSLGLLEEHRGTLNYDSFEKLYTTTYRQKEYSKAISASRATIDDDRLNIIQNQTRQLATATDKTIMTHAAAPFNDAFSTERLGGDGKPLVATDHPLSPTSSDTISNHTTDALSVAAMKDARIAMMQFTDSRGQPAPSNPDTLVIGPGLSDLAEVIVTSTLESGGNSNNTNTLRTMSVIVDPYITSQTAWFLVDSRMSRLYLRWLWRVRPEFATDPSANFDLEARWRVYARFVNGYDNWRFVFGSTGA